MSAPLVSRSAALCAENARIIDATRGRIALGWRICRGWRGIQGGSECPTESPPEPLDEPACLVRERLRRGELFPLASRSPYWAGPATGQPCTVCSRPIADGNECEVRGPGGSAFAHFLCHRLWWSGRKPGTGVRGRPASRGGVP